MHVVCTTQNIVKARINIHKNSNRILKIVKAKENLKNKSQAIDFVTELYGKEVLGQNFESRKQKNSRNLLKNLFLDLLKIFETKKKP